MKSKRIAYIRQNKEEIDNQTQENLIKEKFKPDVFVYEDVIDDPNKNEKLHELINGLTNGDMVIVANNAVLTDDYVKYLSIVSDVTKIGASIYFIEDDFTAEKSTGKNCERLYGVIAKFNKNTKSYRQAEAAYVPKPKKTVQHLFETVPSNPTKTRVLVSDETSNSVLQMVADGELTKIEAAEKLGVCYSTMQMAFKNKLASGEIIQKTASEIKIEKVKAMLPANWARLYSGYVSGNLKISDMFEASKLKESQIRTLIKYQEAGLLN